jgi:hypothetical protein
MPRPASVRLPVRGGPGFGATVNASCDGPVPEEGVSVIQSAPLDAVHGQSAVVATELEPIPPLPDMSTLVGETEYMQPLSCATETVLPATETDPLRAGPVFAATVTWSWPGPLPVGPPAIVIHVAPLAADHVHPVAVAI